MDQEVRLLRFGRRDRRYKVIYLVDDETRTIRVLHIRHWARKGLQGEDLEQLINDQIDLQDDPKEE